MTDRMRYCFTVIREVMHKKYLPLSWPFRDPVNADALGSAPAASPLDPRVAPAQRSAGCPTITA